MPQPSSFPSELEQGYLYPQEEAAFTHIPPAAAGVPPRPARPNGPSTQATLKRRRPSGRQEEEPKQQAPGQRTIRSLVRIPSPGDNSGPPTAPGRSDLAYLR